MVPRFRPEAITAKALAKEKQERYQSAGDLANDLSCWLARSPVRARTWYWWYTIWRAALQHRVLWLGVTIFAVLAAAAASFALWFGRGKN
jgi:hypothetical protein